MKNPSQKIDLLVRKVVEFSGMDDVQKTEFYDNVNMGFVSRLIVDGRDILSKEVINKINLNPGPVTLKALLKELSETKEGKDFVDKNIELTLSEMILAIQDQLSPLQKEELLKILE